MNQVVKRIQTVDIIRGIALLGILIFNIQTYALFSFLKPMQVYNLGFDKPENYAPLQFILHVLVNGQFYTIYSFLFGLGFYLLYQKNEQLGLDADKIFKRRLWILMLIGLIHGLIFWFGDILHKYAIFGFTLLYFNKKSVKTIFIWIIGLMFFSILMNICIVFLSSNTPESNTINPLILQVIDTWQQGSIGDVIAMQKLGLAMLWIINIESGLQGITHYLCMFLLGLIAGKISFFNHIAKFRKKLLKIAFVIFPIALLLKSIANLQTLQINILNNTSQNFRELFFSLIIFITTPLITFCYLVFMSVIFDKNNSLIFKWIGNTGKLGLTNYLMQSFLCMILFYGYAFGLSGKVTLGETMGIAIIIYIIQNIYSNIWLKYYKTGPIENLWRKLSKS